MSSLSAEELAIISKADIQTPRSSLLTESQINNIFAELQKLPEFDGFSRFQATIVLASFFQSGGTARSCDGNLPTRAFGKPFKLSLIRKALKLAGCPRDERKLARALCDQIFNISLAIGTPGNLSQKIQRTYPNRDFSILEKVYMLNMSCKSKATSLVYSLNYSPSNISTQRHR